VVPGLRRFAHLRDPALVPLWQGVRRRLPMAKDQAVLPIPPAPFVFRPAYLDDHTIRPGQPFYFDLNVFSMDAMCSRTCPVPRAARAGRELRPPPRQADYNVSAGSLMIPVFRNTDSLRRLRATDGGFG